MQNIKLWHPPPQSLVSVGKSCLYVFSVARYSNLVILTWCGWEEGKDWEILSNSFVVRLLEWYSKLDSESPCFVWWPLGADAAYLRNPNCMNQFLPHGRWTCGGCNWSNSSNVLFAKNIIKVCFLCSNLYTGLCFATSGELKYFGESIWKGSPPPILEHFLPSYNDCFCFVF